MLFHLTTDDHICAISEQDGGDIEGGSRFVSEQELGKLAQEWPMKRLVEIWNRLPGVQAVTRFTDRKTAIARIWRAIQPQTAASRTPARRASKPQQQPIFREGSKAAQVLTLLRRPEGATLNEIRNQLAGRPIRCVASSRATCPTKAGRCAPLSATASASIP